MSKRNLKNIYRCDSDDIENKSSKNKHGSSFLLSQKRRKLSEDSNDRVKNNSYQITLFNTLHSGQTADVNHSTVVKTDQNTSKVELHTQSTYSTSNSLNTVFEDVITTDLGEDEVVVHKTRESSNSPEPVYLTIYKKKFIK